MPLPRRLALSLALVVVLVPTAASAVPQQLVDQLERAEERLYELDAIGSEAVEELNAAVVRLEQLEAQREETQAEVATLTDEVAELEELGYTDVWSSEANSITVINPAKIRPSCSASPEFNVLVALAKEGSVWSRTCGWFASRSPEVRLRSTRPAFPLRPAAPRT